MLCLRSSVTSSSDPVPGQPHRVLLSTHPFTYFGRVKTREWQEKQKEEEDKLRQRLKERKERGDEVEQNDATKDGEEDDITLGDGEEMSQFIVLDSPKMRCLTSRTHMRIIRHRESSSSSDSTSSPRYRYTLEDLNSMNGVLVNSTKIHTTHLQDGDILTIGAGKSMAVGETNKKDVSQASDLVYVFYHDQNAVPEEEDQQNRAHAPVDRTSSLTLKPLPSSSSSSDSPSLSSSHANSSLIQRSYSFKPSAKSRRAAALTNGNDDANNDNGSHESSEDGPPAEDEVTPKKPKISLATQLSVIQASVAASAAAAAASESDSTSRKRAREADDASDEPIGSDEKKQRLFAVDADELARRHQADIDAKTAAAVESALAAEKTNAAAATKVAASEARQAMASELSDEFQCAICCDLLIHAMALNCSHTFCKR